MSTIIKFELKELRKLANDTNSCVIEKKVTRNLALQPWCLGNIKESIKNLLDYKIGKFDKEFNGILLSYKSLCILQNVGTIRNDNADIHFQVQADYFIFRPYVGATLKGIVNKKSVTHLGILVHRVFNVVIPRPTEEPGNKWIGSDIQEGQEVIFKIAVLDLYGALPYIRGELDERSLKLGPDGDDEIIEIKASHPMHDVSYVDFEQTKPQKQSPHSTLNNFQGASRHITLNGKSTKEKGDSETTMVDSKCKIPSKKESNQKASDVSSLRQTKTKKQKRDS